MIHRLLIGALIAAPWTVPSLPAQSDPQESLWKAIRKQLSAPEGEQYFQEKIRNAALPWLRGEVVSALSNEGVSRVVLKMPGSEEAEVTLVVHNGPAKLKNDAAAGSVVEFSGVATDFVPEPFMLTFDVGLSGIHGLEFETPPR
jgi:hypothetical protein